VTVTVPARTARDGGAAGALGGGRGAGGGWVGLGCLPSSDIGETARPTSEDGGVAVTDPADLGEAQRAAWQRARRAAAARTDGAAAAGDCAAAARVSSGARLAGRRGSPCQSAVMRRAAS
jgi:hypothetical protein